MKGRLIFLIVLTSMMSCVRETYDMDKFSKKAHLKPSMVISAVQGDVSMNDLFESNDTVIIGNDNFVKVVFKKDSVIDFNLADFYDFSDLVSFSQTYTIGELKLDPFTSTVIFPINQISAKFTPPVTFNNGTYPGFPSFPQIYIGEKPYTPFPNFKNATFSEGTVEINVKNNLPVTLGGLTIRLFNTENLTQIGNDISVPAINAGSNGIGYLNLQNLTFTGSITIRAYLHATTGVNTPVQINLNTTNIEVTVSGKNMKVRSGRVILPVQKITTLDGYDIVDFNPGEGVKIDVVKITSGNLSYSVKGLPLKATMSLTLPTAFRSGDTIKIPLTLNPNLPVSDNYSLNNTTFYLGDIASQPYNKLLLKYSIEVSSNGILIDFNSADEINLTLKLSNPKFDYVKGNFGQRTESIEPDTFDLGIQDILDHITGTFHVSSPSIRLNYTNSFAIPAEIDFRATGYRGKIKKDLDIDTILNYPAAPGERVKSGSVVLNKFNSSLPDLISLPPEKVKFSGSAKMNPAGSTSMNNYVFGNSSFLGSVDVEVPLEFSLKNLQLRDTIDNFLKDENQDPDAPLSAEDIEYLKINITAKNEFPVGISLNLILFNSSTSSKIDSVNANNILKPAIMGNNDRISEAVESTTNIEIDDAFWKSVKQADKIIFRFGAVTSGNNSKDVKIFADYKITYNATLAVKADLNFKLK
jgi:hypothetical protein